MAPVTSPNRVRSSVRPWASRAGACLLAAAVYAVALSGAPLNVRAVRYWSLADVTRVAIEVSGEFSFRSDRLPDPDRVFFDIQDSQSTLQERGIYAIPVGDRLLKQIRIAQTQLTVTRVVLDLEPGVEISTSHLSNPDRLMVELRRKTAGAAPAPPAPPGVTVERRLEPKPETAPPPPAPPAPPPRIVRRFDPPPPAPKPRAPLIAQLPPVLLIYGNLPPDGATPEVLRPKTLAARQAAERAGFVPAQNRKQTAQPKPAVASTAVATPKPADRKPLAAPADDAPAAAARRSSSGGSSLTRALGLKVGRVVIDPGHGGYDVGTIGPAGVYEKNIVLDIAKRLGALVEQRLGSEVVYTRSDDTFIPLETRTEIANQSHADLFLSIHANSSTIRTIGGVETFYLNFSTSREDLDVAARENASAQKSVYELKDLLQRIAKNDKAEESREFASRVQSSLFALAARNNPKLRNRGVKKAPFVVLIGAEMPSILAEIGFISNPREEALLKREDHRQRVAEALCKGLSQYADSLSHFQVAQSAAKVK